MSRPAYTPLGSAAEVLVATGHDAYARGSLRRPLVRGWMGTRATAWVGVDAELRTPYLSALGAPEDVARLLADLLPELLPRQRATLPRGTPARLPAWVGLSGLDWDFRWSDAAPPAQAREREVVEVDDRHAITALLDAASPGASARPDDPAVRRWFGIPGPDGLLACAADTSAATGVGHLSAVAVHPSARRQGLGRAVTAALTRDLLAAGCDVVTLGLYADNAAARALYDGLGFRDEHRFTSGRLTVRGQW